MKNKYIKVIRLDNNDLPIEEIQGRVTSGGINVDGNSNVRRTCNLSLVTDSIEQDYQWSLSSKIKIFIGIEDGAAGLQWHKGGTYYLTSFLAQKGVASQTISISGKDKMVKLNGELGGKLMQQTQFDTEDIEYGGEILHRKVPIKTIVMRAVQQLGGEPAHNIIINDLEEYGLELLENRSNDIIYLARKTTDDYYSQLLLDSWKIKCKIDGNEIYLSQIPVYDNLLLEGFDSDSPSDTTEVYFNNDSNIKYYIAKVDYGELAGYGQTKLIYPSELIGNVGEALTTILDKLCSFLGVFEYFYDLDGRFIFQRKPYQSTVVQGLMAEEDGVNYITTGLTFADKSYKLEDESLLTQISYQPQLSNVANDFSLWSINQNKSCHIRYAIDEKPEIYVTLPFNDNDWEVYKKASGLEFKTKVDEEEAKGKYTTGGGVTYSSDEYDWRELIYRMAVDWYKGNYLDDFEIRLQTANTWCLNGRTGYEQYYEDVYFFWRQIYDVDEPYTVETADIVTAQVKSISQSEDNLKLYGDKVEVKGQIIIPALYDDSQEKYALYTPYSIYDSGSQMITNESLTLPVINDNVLITDNKIIGINNNIYLGTSNSAYLYYEKEPYISSSKYYFPRVYRAVKNGNGWLVEINVDANDSYSIQDINEYGGYCIKTHKYKVNTYYYKNELGNFVLDDNSSLVVGRQYYKYVNELYTVNFGPWRQTLINNPDLLTFWIDFLDPRMASGLSQFSVKQIGQRPYAKTDNDIGAIYYKQAPPIIYNFTAEERQRVTGYAYMQAIGYDGLFNMSDKKKTGLEAIEDLIAEKSYLMNSLSFAMIPDYTLDVNKQIKILDKGTYIINKLTIPLDYAGLMQVQVSQKPMSLY